MFIRSSLATSRLGARSFSSSSQVSRDIARLTLLGRLARQPTVSVDKNGKEYATIVVATSHGYGDRAKETTFHRIISYLPQTTSDYAKSCLAGTSVLLEAAYKPRSEKVGEEEYQKVSLFAERFEVVTAKRAQDGAGESESGFPYEKEPASNQF